MEMGDGDMIANIYLNLYNTLFELLKPYSKFALKERF